MRWILLLLPWIELWTLIELGAATSGLVALAWVFLSLMLGVSLIRRQGMQALRDMQQQSGGQILGPRLLMDDLAMISSGLLLIIPGLITDVMALVFLIGPLRRRLPGARGAPGDGFGGRREGGDPPWQDHPSGAADAHAPRRPADQVTLEGDYQRLDEP